MNFKDSPCCSDSLVLVSCEAAVGTLPNPTLCCSPPELYWSYAGRCGILFQCSRRLARFHSLNGTCLNIDEFHSSTCDEIGNHCLRRGHQTRGGRKAEHRVIRKAASEHNKFYSRPFFLVVFHRLSCKFGSRGANSSEFSGLNFPAPLI
jgi:hypothetical protein